MLANVLQLSGGKSLMALRQLSQVAASAVGKLRDNQSLVTGTKTTDTLPFPELHFTLVYV